MHKDFTIGLVVPFATDTVPDEGLQMYPRRAVRSARRRRAGAHARGL